LAHFREAAPHLPAILVEHDITFTLYRQYAERHPTRGRRREAALWREFESRWLSRYDAVWTMSAADREMALAAGGPRAATLVVPNGVDIRRFAPAGPPPPGDPEILYIGSFRHRPNVMGFDLLRTRIMPRVWERFPAARLRVVAGPEPEKHWERPDRLDARILVHGFVEDVRPLYAAASVVAVPLVVSAGTNIKVLEAMACGRPVVTTPVGCQGLDLVDGEDALVRAAPEAFADAVCALLDRPEEAARLAANARRTAEERFSWDAIAEAAYASYQRLMEVR
jgi:glycosyltransferase involved in cell wall biosynthesis